MNSYSDMSYRTGDVYKFIFFANNDILIISSVNIFNNKNLIIDSSPLVFSGIIFIIDCIYYITKFAKNCSMSYAEDCFDWDHLCELFKIPWFIWQLRILSDPCCRSTGYSIYIFSDGHIETTKCCHYLWNCFIYLVKRLAIIFTILSYFIFLLFYLIFWLLVKLIFLLISNCKCNCKCKCKKDVGQKTQPQPTINNKNIIENPNLNSDEINNG